MRELLEIFLSFLWRRSNRHYFHSKIGFKVSLYYKVIWVVSHLGNLRLRSGIRARTRYTNAFNAWYMTVVLFVAPINTLFLKEDFGNEK